jgi:hypothetical protein
MVVQRDALVVCSIGLVIKSHVLLYSRMHMVVLKGLKCLVGGPFRERHAWLSLLHAW